MQNIDAHTVQGFGDEWRRFDQTALASSEQIDLFNQYFLNFPWRTLPAAAVGFDAGCGSGRWASLVAARVGEIHCVDASAEALVSAKRNLAAHTNAHFHWASVDAMPLLDGSMDFGYSLGVLHHVPDTLGGLRSCVAKLKPGAPFLLYLYYRFDNRPIWFIAVWRLTDVLRRIIAHTPLAVRHWLTQLIALLVYWPLARSAAGLERLGANVEGWPLTAYRHLSFYTMRTDARDRFGTRLEQRFTRREIEAMMTRAGLERIVFNEAAPYWCALGFKA